MNAAWAMPQPAVWHLTARDVEIKQQLNANQGRTLLDKYQEAKARIMLERKPIVSSFSCPLKLPTWIEMPYTDPVLHSNLQPHTTPSHKCGSCNQEGTFFHLVKFKWLLRCCGLLYGQSRSRVVCHIPLLMYRKISRHLFSFSEPLSPQM